MIVTDNRRLPLRRRFAPEDLQAPADLRDSSAVAGELFRLRNGERLMQQRYAQASDIFTKLTARTFTVHARPDPQESTSWLIDVQITIDGYQVPAAFAGVGVQESLLLSLLAAGDPGRFILLDEPAVHLEPSLQRRLAASLGTHAQCSRLRRSRWAPVL